MTDRDFQSLGDSADAVEASLWQALEMDALHDKMTQTTFPENNPIFMGTGHTNNACYHCSNSATTHGCNTCSM